MIIPLLLVLLTPPALAAEAPAADPGILSFEKELTGKLVAKKSGALKPEDYQAWEKGFRARLAELMEKVPGSPDNQAAHARITALLGDKKEAGAALDQALGGNPDNPVLLRTKGRLLLEQNDYSAAAEHGLRAYESSGRTDKDALALYHTAKAGLITGAAWVAAKKTGENVSYSKSENPQAQSRPATEDWHKGTFDTTEDSIKYHLEKHGNGRTIEEYTRAAVDFFKANKGKAKKVMLKDNTPGWQIKGKTGGYWTENGRVVTFWD